MGAKQAWAAFASDSEIEIKTNRIQRLILLRVAKRCATEVRSGRTGTTDQHGAVSMTLACHPCAISM
jgi:hypothetical protein